MFSGVDVEDENILSTIFRESFPESWRDNSDFSQYLAELSSYGIDKLSREPDRLADERAQILEQTQDLAFDNYKTFIQTAECSREIFQDFQIIERHVDSMLDRLPTLSDECRTFIDKAQQINLSRRLHSTTLSRHTQLLEVLEIPQLMDTCVRNGYYDEALELAAYTRRLHSKLASVPVVVSIVAEVQQSMQLLLSQLLQQLRSTLQLPACLRVIGFLRRIDVFTEAELRIKFLQARDTWFQSILNAIPTSDPYHHITKTIEASRVHLFDIVTQYRAIFSDEDPLLLTTSSRDDQPDESALFHGWIMQKVSSFVSTLEHDLARGVGGRLDSLLGQCMYFGLSFSRVGADFRARLAPVFQKAALQGLKTGVDQGTADFQEAMQMYTVMGGTGVFPSSTVYSLATSTASSTVPAAPLSLLEHRPLAAYCNAMLAALNDLRLCAPLSIAFDATECLQGSLRVVVSTILSYHRSEEPTFNDEERERFGRFCCACANELVPYIGRCLQTLFPPADLANILGLPVSELLRKNNVGSIDEESILEPLQAILPAPQDPQESPIGDNPQSTAVETSEGGVLEGPSSKTERHESLATANATDQSADGNGPETDQSADDNGPETDQSADDNGPETDQFADGNGPETDQLESQETDPADEGTTEFTSLSDPMVKSDATEHTLVLSQSDVSIEGSTSGESDVSVIPATASATHDVATIASDSQ